MKKLLFISILLIGLFGYSQAKSEYQRLGKLTQTEIDAVDVSDTSVVYTAFNTTTGREEINTGSGWEARNTGGTGPQGDSAYQVAVSEGFVGTEAEWVASLQGEQGEPGADGAGASYTFAPSLTNTGGEISVTDPVTAADRIKWDTDYLPLTGGTISGDINSGNNNILDIGQLSWESDTGKEMTFGYTGDVFELAPFAGQGFNYTHSTDRWGIGNLDFQGNIAIDKASETGREDIFTATIDDSPNDVFGISNGTVTNNLFLPVFYGFSRAGNQALLFRGLGLAADDVIGSKPYMQFLAANTTVPDPNNGLFSAPVNRTLFSWGTTNDERFMEIEADGTVKVKSLAGNGAGVVGVDNDGNLSYSAGGGSGVSNPATEDFNLNQFSIVGAEQVAANYGTFDFLTVGSQGVATEAYVDAAAQTATEVPYDNTTSGLTADTAQEAIDEIAASGGSVSNKLIPAVLPGGGITTITSVDGDTGNKIFEYNGASVPKDVTFPDVLEVGESVSFRQQNSQKIRVDFTGTGTGGGTDFQTADSGGSVTVWKGTYGYTNDGNWEAFTPTPPPLYSSPDAANPDPEANALPTTTSIGHITASIETTKVDNGSYSVKLTRTNGTFASDYKYNIGSNFVIGNNYTVTIRVSVEAGSTGYWKPVLPTTQGWDVMDEGLINLSSATGTYQTIVLTGNAAATTCGIQFTTNASADNGSVIIFDNITVTENP